MAHRFPSRTTVLRTRLLIPLAATSIAIGAFLLADYYEGPLLAVGYLCLAAGLGTLIVFRNGTIGPAFNARDHLRHGERCRLFLLGYASAASMLGVLAYNGLVPDKPLWAYYLIAPWFGIGALVGVLVMTRINRNPARRGCPGTYDDCRDCDLSVPIVELKATLDHVAETALDQWLIDPETGVEIKVDPKRYLIYRHTIDDDGHEVHQMYLFGAVTGAHVARLVPIVAYDDGFRDLPNLEDDALLETLSMQPDEVNAFRAQIARTLV
ncbi:hypothetical protein LO763_20035 [Glycomyces sp. A-F 0318]|uniref:hypothetical protein n=1 Tax=Glycomyces amatae TaxID=2881355 RepID=UPI001E6569A1|nr:hypothetical protein [Glycomyces amatae]MCD0445904.1 hypothetical protein [Glycomyces amatae]